MSKCNNCYHRKVCIDGANYKTAESCKHYVSAADVQEVKHGRWIPERDPDENNRIQCFHCSVCDDDYHYIGAFVATKYCPNCGARMDGEKNG